MKKSKTKTKTKKMSTAIRLGLARVRTGQWGGDCPVCDLVDERCKKRCDKLPGDTNDCYVECYNCPVARMIVKAKKSRSYDISCAWLGHRLEPVGVKWHSLHERNQAERMVTKLIAKLEAEGD